MQFLLLDLRSGDAPELQPKNLAALAKRIPADQVHLTVQELLNHTDQPVVLICEDGEISSKTGEDLAIKGYRNVFVVTGGASQLLKEWEQSTNG